MNDEEVYTNRKQMGICTMCKCVHQMPILYTKLKGK